MNRLDALTDGWTPFLILGVALLMGVVAMAVRTRRRRGGSRERVSEALDGFSDLEESEGEESRPSELHDFPDVLRRFVVPQRAAHPDWDRLDGAVGVPGRPLLTFERDGTRYAINGETRFEPLLAAMDWMAAHPGEDPMEVAQGGKVGRLRLRREVWPAARDVRIETI